MTRLRLDPRRRRFSFARIKRARNCEYGSGHFYCATTGDPFISALGSLRVINGLLWLSFGVSEPSVVWSRACNSATGPASSTDLRTVVDQALTEYGIEADENENETGVSTHSE